jgi:acetyl-CoA synthetase
MEVESALVHHDKVAEAAVVGKPDDIKGEAICCFVTLVGGVKPTEELKKELQAHVVKEIGALARPDEIRFTESLPKTRSGKIMRRLLRDVASGRQTTGDTTTLEDFSVLAKLREEEE